MCDRLLHAGDCDMESLTPLSTEDALAAVEQAVLERLPEGSRQANLRLTTDNGTQFTSSRFIETLDRLSITHRCTAYHQPEGNSYIERFHCSPKEEESLDGRVSELGRSANPDQSLDRRVQPRPASPRSPQSHPRTRPSWLLQLY